VTPTVPARGHPRPITAIDGVARRPGGAAATGRDGRAYAAERKGPPPRLRTEMVRAAGAAVDRAGRVRTAGELYRASAAR